MNWTPVAIAIGAVLGALSRYAVTQLGLRYFGSDFPYGTLFANLTGSLLMGLGAIGLESIDGAIALKQMILVGFLGSYTTFSSYILDTLNLQRRGRVWLSITYWLGSAGLGLVSIAIGQWLGQWLWDGVK